MLRRLALLLVFAAPAALAQPYPCTGGTATDGSGTTYACDGVDLMSNLPRSTFSSPGSSAPSAMNDIWGWTDAASGREFAIVGMTNGTAFVEITDPANPVYLGKLPTASFSSSWRDIKVYADHAFVVSEASSHGMQVFDLSRLLSIVASPPQTFSADANYTLFGDAHNIVMDEDAGLAVVVGSFSAACGGGGLHMIDVTTPTSPSFAGCFSADGYTHDAQCVTYDGPDTDYTGHQICMASNEDTLTIVDVSNPSSPVQISRSFYPSPSYTHQGWFTEGKRYFVVNDELDGGSSTPTRTIVFDVTDLDNPGYHFAHSGTSNARDHNLYIRDRYVFQSNYAAGLRILDGAGISLGSMFETAYFDTYPANDFFSFNGQWSNYPYYPSGMVVASDISNGLFVLRPDVLVPTGGTGPIVFTAPTQGETLSAGTTTTVTWDPGGVPAGVTMKLNLKSPTEGNSTIANNVPNTGSYSWSIPATQASATDYRIVGVYTDPTSGDKVRPKTGTFEITGGVAPPTPITVTAPSTGAVWAAGTTQTIMWDPGDIPASVKLQVRLLGNGSNVRLEKNVDNDGSWDWSIDAGQATGTEYKIMLVYTDPTTGQKVKPKSDFFEITGPPAAKSGAAVALGDATPNPARGRTTVPFQLAEAADVRVSVHDARGREVAVLADGYRQRGEHVAAWETGDLAPGVYVVRLAAGASVTTRRVVVVR